MPKLTVVTSEGEQTLELTAGRPVTVGRDPGNDLPLPHETKSSRRHCRFTSLPSGGWQVEDLGSTNGTRVNGAAVEKRVLASGDVVEVGAVRIRYVDPAEEERLAKAGAEGVCYLEWATPERKGERVLLTAARTTLGRRETNTVALPGDRMASGHHAEIVKDINGYTIRDLGSTNGTTVNGQPVSESMLTHGMRVRVGNSKFVFKDPSMKDVEVELSQFDEDAGWGMMGEIDLSKARGSKGALLVVVALFAAAGGGLWWLGQQEGKAPAATAEVSGNRVENGSFEEEDVPWIAEREDLVDVKRVATPGGAGHALSLAHAGEEGGARVLVASVTDLSRIGGRPYRVRAKFRRQAGEADLVVAWESRPEREELRAGVVPLTRTLVLPVSGAGAVDAVVVPPGWSNGGRLAVRLAPGGRALLDDVRVELAAEDLRTPVLEGPDPLRPLTVDPDGAAALVATRTVLFVGAVPVARMPGAPAALRFRAEEVPPAAEGGSVTLRGRFEAGEEARPGSVTWRGTEEGFRAEISCDGAEQVGLDVDLVGAHLGGAVNLLGAFAPQPLPATPGQRLAGVAKILAGDAETTTGRPPVLVAFVPSEGRPEATVEILPADDAGLVRTRQWLPGAAGTVDVLTSFTLQKRRAEQALAQARASLQERPGAAIKVLRELEKEFPFDKAIGGEALQLADEREKKAQADLDALEAGLGRYRVYGSRDALEAVEKQAKAIAREIVPDGPRPDAGPLESRAAALVAQVGEARREHDRGTALPELIRLERIATLLAEDQATWALAALYARAILQRYGSYAGEDSDVGRRVDAIRERLDRLSQNSAVAAALPPEPGAAGG